jgi:Ca-activated chloride channel family protein
VQVLTGLTQVTGGKAFFPKVTGDLPEVCKSIAEKIRNQYVIGYRSRNSAADGKWRKITVKVDPPKGMTQLVVRAKSGYYAPRSARP